MTLGDNRVNVEGIARIGSRDANRLYRYLVRKDDIIYSRRGDVETRALIGRREHGWLCGTGCLRVRLGESGVNPQYAVYTLGHPAIREWIVRHAHCATIQYLNTELLWACPFVIPPQFDQRSIARILGTLDDKIDLNQPMNETPEKMVHVLYKSWFIDFDPVRAKMEDRETGLPQHVAESFPNRLVDSELGEVPERWPLVPLPKLIEVTPKRLLRRGTSASYLEMANMPRSGHVPGRVIERAISSGMRFANGDTLVARITLCLENGKIVYVDFLRDEEIGWGATEHIVMKPIRPLPDEFAYCLARSPRFREFAIQNMSGTSGGQRVPATSLTGFLIPSRPPRVAAEFGRMVKPFSERVRSGVNQSRTLAACRDTLLPRLLSGELRIPVANRLHGERSDG